MVLVLPTSMLFVYNLTLSSPIVNGVGLISRTMKSSGNGTTVGYYPNRKEMAGWDNDNVSVLEEKGVKRKEGEGIGDMKKQNSIKIITPTIFLKRT